MLLNGFKTIVQQIHRESPGYTFQRVLDYCSVDSWDTLGYSSQRVLDYCPVEIHRESLGYSSQRVLDYCPVDSQGVPRLFFSTGSRLLPSRFTGSRWVILLDGFKTIVQQIHRESRGYSSQRVLDYCPVDSQEVAGLFFPTGSRLLSSRFSGSRWVILLNGFQTIVKQIHRESLGYASQRVQDYCPVDSQGVAGLYFSTGSRLLFSRFMGHAGLFFPTGSRLLSSRDSQGVAGLFFSTGSRLQSGRYSQGVVGLFFSTGSRLLSSRFTRSRWVILLNGFKTIVQQILRESLGYAFQRVIDNCPEYSRESLGYSSQRVLDYCPVDSQGVAGIFYSTGSGLLSSRYSQGIAGLFFSTGSRLLSSRFTGGRWLFFSTVSRLLSIRDSQGVAGLFFSTVSLLLSSRDSQGITGLFF